MKGADAICSGNDFCVNIIPGKEMPLRICDYDFYFPRFKVGNNGPKETEQCICYHIETDNAWHEGRGVRFEDCGLD